MAYREVAMWEILNVLRRIGRGESQSAVARATGHGRKTVRRYVAVAGQVGWEPGVADPTEALAAEVYLRLRPSRGRAPGDAQARLLPHRERIGKWIEPGPGEKRGLRLTKVHQLLARQGVEVPYSSLHRFAVKQCGFSDRRRMTVRVAECAPGELAEVDFGRLGLLRRRDPAGRARQPQGCDHEGGSLRSRLPAHLRGVRPLPRLHDRPHAPPAPHWQATRGAGCVLSLRDSLFRGEHWLDRKHVQREAVCWCL